MHIYGKTFKKSSTEPSPIDLEAWHGPLGSQSQKMLYMNDDPGLTLTGQIWLKLLIVLIPEPGQDVS